MPRKKIAPVRNTMPEFITPKSSEDAAELGRSIADSIIRDVPVDLQYVAVFNFRKRLVDLTKAKAAEIESSHKSNASLVDAVFASIPL